MTEAVAFSAKTAEAIAADREARRLRTRNEKLACAIFQELTGVELPDVIPFHDEHGNKYMLRVHASIDLVRRAEEESHE